MSFTYTNTTQAVDYDPTIKLGMSSNYARITDEPNMARVTNKTASIEQPELITYRCDPIKKVSTAINVMNPSPNLAGVQYTVKIEEVDRAVVGSDTIDEPIAMWLTIKHPTSNRWDNAKVASVFRRLVSALLKDQATTGSAAPITDATDWRFEDLMRSALMPTQD